MKPLLLSLVPLGKTSRRLIQECCETLGLELQVADDAEQRQAALAGHAGRVAVVLTNGTTGLSGAEIAAMKQLGLIAALGVGYEGIALDAARQQGVAVVNGAGSNADCVADHALALLLCLVRGVRQLDIACRAGIWRNALPVYPQLAGKRVGIVGFGAIGSKIAKRLQGFDTEVAYHSRTRRAESPLQYFADLSALAQWCNHLVVATPGGAGTFHLINAGILEKLDRKACLVNVARGSVVDTAALAAALRENRLGGAGLDVYESEPQAPHELLEFENVVLTPHVGGNSAEAIAAAIDMFIANLQRHCAGESLLTPVD